MGKLFKDKSWNEKTELERFETLVDEFHEILWGTVRRPEVKFGNMMMKKPPTKRKRVRKADVNEAWENE